MGAEGAVSEELVGQGSSRRTKSGQVSRKASKVELVWTSYWRSMAVGIGGVASYAILQYGGFVWIQSYLAHHGMGPQGRMRVALVSRVLMILLGLPVAGLLM